LETIAKTATRWAELNPVLEIGSEGIESDTGLTKVGDGVSRWTDLPYPGTRVKGIQTFSTLDRPSASAEGVGAAYYDTTLGLPGFSNGTVWKDAAGNVI
jgi:hypothetical protein